MSTFLLNVLLAIAWGALMGSFTPLNLLFGFGLGYLILWVSLRKTSARRYFQRAVQVLEFSFFFLKELIQANLRLAITILSPRLDLRPAVVSIPLELNSESSIVLLMNLITLTPGTLSLDVSSDRKMIFVHALYVEDPESFRDQIQQQYMRRVKELFE